MLFEVELNDCGRPWAWPRELEFLGSDGRRVKGRGVADTGAFRR